MQLLVLLVLNSLSRLKLSFIAYFLVPTIFFLGLSCLSNPQRWHSFLRAKFMFPHLNIQYFSVFNSIYSHNFFLKQLTLSLHL